MESSKVVLYVYDLSQGMARALSASILGKQIDAIYHTGIVVYNTEYYYGGGIQAAQPGGTMAGTPQQTITLGETHIPQDVFHEFLHNISSRFTAETYSLLRHNCNNFTNECAQFLIGSQIPTWITGLPEEALNSPLGQMLRPVIEQFEMNMKRQMSNSFVPWQESNSNALNLPATPSSSSLSSSSSSTVATTTSSFPKSTQQNVVEEKKQKDNFNKPKITVDNKLKQYFTLIKIISKKLDSSLQLTTNEYVQLQTYIKGAQEFDDNVFMIVERIMNQWPITVIFPVLGVFRYFTRFSHVAERLLKVDDFDKSIAIQRLFTLASGRYDDGNKTIKVPDRAIAFSILANLVGKSLPFAIKLVNNESILDSLVTALINDQNTVRLAAIDLAYNLSLMNLDNENIMNASIRLTTGLTEALLSAQKAEIVYQMLLVLKLILIKNEEAVQLIQAIEFDFVNIQQRFIQNNNIKELSQQLKQICA